MNKEDKQLSVFNDNDKENKSSAKVHVLVIEPREIEKDGKKKIEVVQKGSAIEIDHGTAKEVKRESKEIGK